MAEKDCDDALDAEPKNAAFLDSRGWLHVRRAEWRQVTRQVRCRWRSNVAALQA